MRLPATMLVLGWVAAAVIPLADKCPDRCPEGQTLCPAIGCTPGVMWTAVGLVIAVAATVVARRLAKRR